MENLYLESAYRLGAAWFAGCLIGFDRSYHEKPAGFRTHPLVWALLQRHKFKLIYMSYRLCDDGEATEYRMTIRTSNEDNLDSLAKDLLGMPTVREFRLAPTGETKVAPRQATDAPPTSCSAKTRSLQARSGPNREPSGIAARAVRGSF